MMKRTVLAACAALMLTSSSGCCCWQHCWGSWAYYGGQNTYGYCDNCRQGPCGGPGCGGHGCFGPLDCVDDCTACNACGNGCCGNCAPCGGHVCCLRKLFHSPGPVGCYPCSRGGCGGLYVCDWCNCPPCPDPCDRCGNHCYKDPCCTHYLEPRPGSIALHRGEMGPGPDGYWMGEADDDRSFSVITDRR